MKMKNKKACDCDISRRCTYWYLIELFIVRCGYLNNTTAVSVIYKYILLLHEYTHRYVCTIHLLRHWSRFAKTFAPSHTPDIAYIRCYSLSTSWTFVCYSRCCISPQIQPGSEWTFGRSHRWNKSGCLPFQKADCLASWVCSSKVPEIPWQLSQHAAPHGIMCR